ncbi:pteridine-dependent deoxygenase [Thermomonas sp. HDW16]|uniref:chorismate transformation enzyme, FkbO/Hyg5 family n=1 Tax=Thermomonas sp. HDW16 TaxID=2714945 RepID=UPI001F100C66|nr:pteridine-dependent deoxygenase [Thermomonas sp. HDW16]
MNDTAPHPATAALRVDYRREPLDALLADPRLLAVFGFGDAAPATHVDPRYLHVALPTLGDAPFECWFVDGGIRSGRENGIAFSGDGTLQFGALDVADDDDIETAAADAYARLQTWLANSGYPHPLRIWNYMDAITEGDGDDERYRRFCVGRARGIGRALAAGELPAATAIGLPHRSGRFQLYWLAARTPGQPLENPRQLQAWRYPRQYGPQAPGFARALLPAQTTMPLLLSGTAAIVGHASQHGDSLASQLDEVLANLDSLVVTARAQRPGLAAHFGTASRLKVYVRDAGSLPHVAALLDARLPTDVPRIVLHGHVCRRELAVEIDGSHA